MPHLSDTMPLDPTVADIVLRLVLTMVASALLGFNRERGGHAAGFRTTILVSLAACIAMIQANILLDASERANGSMDILRFPLGVLTGVGFIGGGAILRRGDLITGVTTAATLWLITTIGLCFGGGQIILGVIATAAALAVLAPFKHVDMWIRREQKALVIVRIAAHADVPDLSPCLSSSRGEARLIAFRQSNDGSREISFELQWLASDRETTRTPPYEIISRQFDVIEFRLASKTE
ncbi:MgtC/SapB family protein [Agrobacterium vitis]|nr:MgtC/SapB family protein [Agrobacterium vitis]